MAARAGSKQAALSRDLSEFLVELSIALHKHAMYPDGHPSLEPAAEMLVRRADALLATRTSLSLGVARRQLVIEGVATDPKHPVLRELAGRLHRHHLGAVTVHQAVTLAEMTDVLRRLAVDGERSGRPLGFESREERDLWPHIRLHPLTFERLELQEEGAEGGIRAAQLWVGLARAAIAGDDGTEGGRGAGVPESTEPDAIARAIDAPPRSAAYDQVIVGYLLQIANELKASGGAGAESVVLKRRVSNLMAAMRPETVRRLIEMGGDVLQRRTFVLDAAHGWSLDAVLEIVRAAAEASGETISHGLLRMFSKMARYADSGSEASRHLADTALREQVTSLVSGWTLENPSPDAYGRALEGMAAAPPERSAAEAGAHLTDPLRLVQIALEADQPAAVVWRAVANLIESNQVGAVAELLDGLPPQHATGREVWRRIATPVVVRRLLTDPPDFKTLDQMLPRLDPQALEPLFETLAASSNRATRRGLLDRLARAPVDIAPLLLRGLSDERWYVQRNMLVLLDTLPGLPEGFSPAGCAGHPDPRVRREAFKLRVKVPAERDAAILAAVDDPDAQVASLALMAAHQHCPIEVASAIARRFEARNANEWPRELRMPAIKALGRAKSPQALDALLIIVDGGKTWFGRRRLAVKSPELLAALQALDVGWRRDARARALLHLAARSDDPEIRVVAGHSG